MLKAALAQAMAESMDSWSLEEMQVAESEVRDRTRAFERGLREEMPEQGKEQRECEKAKGDIGSQGGEKHIGDISGEAMQEVREILSRLHI